MALISACSSYHKYAEYDLSSYDEQDALKHIPNFDEYRNYSVVLDSGHATGMGVPISSNHIATVAHVVGDLKIGDYVKVFNLGDEKSVLDGKLIYVSPLDEVAVIDIEQGHKFAIPQLCDNSFGGQRIYGAKPTDIRHAYTGMTNFSGVVTNTTILPLVTDSMNEKILIESNINTKAMSGLRRVVMYVTSPGAAGNSGGAIIDIDNKCVVALVSMNARISDFKEPEKIMKDVGFSEQYYEGTAPNLMIGVPVNYYKKWAK